MPVLIIGGPEADKEEKRPMKERKIDGIGGGYMPRDEEDSTDSEKSSNPEQKKTEAGKMVLDAVKAGDPKQVAEAIITLVQRYMDSGEGE